MISRCGAGPSGCPIHQLTTEKLISSFHILASDEIQNNVTQLSQQMNQETGVLKGIESFFRNLPLEDMICEVSLFRQQSEIASFYCRECHLKMSSQVDQVIHRSKSGRQHHLRVPYRCVRWGVDPPNGLAEGLQQGFGVVAYEIAGGFYDLVAKPIEGGLEHGAKGLAEGVAQGVVSFIARPIKGGQILIDRISQSVSNDPIRRNRTVHESLKSIQSDKRAHFLCREDDDELHHEGREKEEMIARIDEPREDRPEDLTEEENDIEEV
jgi:hypothetical protein